MPKAAHRPSFLPRPMRSCGLPLHRIHCNSRPLVLPHPLSANSWWHNSSGRFSLFSCRKILHAKSGFSGDELIHGGDFMQALQSSALSWRPRVISSFVVSGRRRSQAAMAALRWSSALQKDMPSDEFNATILVMLQIMLCLLFFVVTRELLGYCNG